MSTTHPCIECAGEGFGYVDSYRGAQDIQTRVDCTECDGTGQVSPACHVCDEPADLGHVEHVWCGRTVSRWLCERCHDELEASTAAQAFSLSQQGRPHWSTNEDHDYAAVAE